MVRQTVLPIKLEITKNPMSSRSGLIAVAEYYKAIGLRGLINRYLPAPGSHRGFKPAVFSESLCLMLTSGGRSLEDLRELNYESGLIKALGQALVPSPDAMGNWLRRMGQEINGRSGLEGLNKVHRQIVKRLSRRDTHQSYTLDMDASEIIADKYESKTTYKGNQGYMPIFGFLAETGLCLHHEFRNGNASPNSRQKDFYLACKAQMPAGKAITYVRVDGAGYNSDLMNHLEDDNVKYVIRAHRSKGLKKLIKKIPESQWHKAGSSHRRYEVTSMRYVLPKVDKALRMVIKREMPSQPELFDKDVYFYWCLITNIEEQEKTDEELITFYNQRGQAENLIKELKAGFGMSRMPCGHNHANAMFLSLGVLAYNLFMGFKRLSCPQAWQHHTISTLRWKLINIAGQVVYHGRQVILKLQADRRLLNIFEEIRSKIYEFSLLLG